MIRSTPSVSASAGSASRGHESGPDATARPPVDLGARRAQPVGGGFVGQAQEDDGPWGARQLGHRDEAERPGERLECGPAVRVQRVQGGVQPRRQFSVHGNGSCG